MAGLGLFGKKKKSVIAATMPIATAIKLCIRQEKWTPESLTEKSQVLAFWTRFLCRALERAAPSKLYWGAQNLFLLVACRLKLPWAMPRCPGPF
jgi:hypothetical protein